MPLPPASSLAAATRFTIGDFDVSYIWFRFITPLIYKLMFSYQIHIRSLYHIIIASFDFIKKLFSFPLLKKRFSFFFSFINEMSLMQKFIN